MKMVNLLERKNVLVVKKYFVLNNVKEILLTMVIVFI